MKKIFISLLLISIGIITGILLTNNVYKSHYSNNIVSNTTTSNLVKSNSIAMMIETDLDSEEYYLSTDTTWPESGYAFNENLSKCENGATLSWDSDNNQVLMTGTRSDKCYIYFDMTGQYDYNGSEQTFTVRSSGTYLLEVWGAQGGSTYGTGGYGAYSVGEIYLEEDTVLYINVGGQPDSYTTGGYNGGGEGFVTSSGNAYRSSGGGATHISLVSGILSDLEDYKGKFDDDAGVYRSEYILIIAGGGGGGGKYTASIQGGSGGGIYGGNPYYNTSGSSTTVKSNNIGAFQYASTNSIDNNADADAYNHTVDAVYNGSFGSAVYVGGGGLYGGDFQTVPSVVYSGSGGSGYIGNSSLTNKAMYCYECSESTDEDTYTVSTTNVSDTAISMYAKSGNGYAKITKVS